MSLGGCDLVLRMQMLGEFGVIGWDCKNLTMSIEYKEEKLKLRGNSQIHPKNLKPKKVDKLLQQGLEAYNVQFLSAGDKSLECRSATVAHLKQDQEMDFLLQQYSTLFKDYHHPYAWITKSTCMPTLLPSTVGPTISGTPEKQQSNRWCEGNARLRSNLTNFPSR